MGLSLMGRGSFGDSYKTEPRNPNPALFKLLQVEGFMGAEGGVPVTVAQIKYPNCTNYEGNKVLVFRGLTPKQVRGFIKIDPHFTESSKVFARFAPTDLGWDMAIKFAQTLVWVEDGS